jgi:hypothetical protein
MATNSERLQNSYAQIADETEDGKTDSFIKNTDAIMGRPAELLLAQAGIDSSTTEPFRLFDSACGTGALGAQVQRIVDRSVLEKSHLLCGDVSQGFLDILKKRAAKEKWVNTEIATIDAQVNAPTLCHVMTEKAKCVLRIRICQRAHSPM